MNKICTTPEQSKKFIELGVDVNTADMQWVNTGYCMRVLLADDYEAQSSSSKTPAWSLTTLFNILPKGASLLKNSYDETCAIINTDFENEDVKIEWYNDPIDACYERIIWLKENGKL